MSSNQKGGSKLPGKTEYAGRRRPMTRKSGFTIKEGITGAEFRRVDEKVYILMPHEEIEVVFYLHGHAVGNFLGYGVWFWCTNGVKVSVIGGPDRRTLTEYKNDSWNKVGSIWKTQTVEPVIVRVKLTAIAEGKVAIYSPICGRIQHKHLDDAREALLRNMFKYAPEAIFPDNETSFLAKVLKPREKVVGKVALVLKACNRCGRFLPINVINERDHLSFTNHCTATRRLPCTHATASKLRNEDDPTDVLKLSYGFEQECRFCRKFEVNAPLNSQRTSAQMKEDGARRRAFELLLSNLYDGSAQLQYRQKHSSELTNDVWENFGHACFNCGVELKTSKEMHLDHTRPLALLWPLDSTATALCGSCNTSKRDRSPVEFYTAEKLSKLSEITGVSISDLKNDKPNEEAIELLSTKLDWFFDEFLMRPEMTKERDGKIVGENVVKALQKVIARSSRFSHIDLQQEYEARRIQKQ